MKNNDLGALNRTLPRLGSRVRIPSPAPNLIETFRIIVMSPQGGRSVFLGDCRADYLGSWFEILRE
jgi:hypothetical protein